MLAGVCLLLIICSMGMGMIMLAFVQSEKTVRGLFQFIVMVMTALSGGFVPIGELQSTTGSFTLSYWAMQSMLRIMVGDIWNNFSIYVFILTAITCLFMIMTIGLSRKAVSYAKFTNC